MILEPLKQGLYKGDMVKHKLRVMSYELNLNS